MSPPQSLALDKATSKIGHRVDKLTDNIQKELYRRGAREEREEMACVVDLRFDLNVWVHQASIYAARTTHPSLRSPHLGSCPRRAFLDSKRNTFVAPTKIVDFSCRHELHSKKVTYWLFDPLMNHPSESVIPQPKMAMRLNLCSLNSTSR